MAGKQSWDSPQVKAVFNKWRELFPYYSEGALGLTLAGRRGTAREQAGRHVPARRRSSRAAMKPANGQGHRLLPVPGRSIRKWGQDSIDAPIDGYMISKKPKNLEAPKKLVGFLGTAPAIDAYLAINSGNLGANKAHEHGEVLAAAEEVGKADRLDEAHRAVHGPRHAARLRLDGDDPVAAEFLNNPGDINKPRQEHREAEEGDLRSRELGASRRDGDRHRNEREGGGARKREARRPPLDRAIASRWRSWSASRCSSRSGLIWFPTISSIGLSFTNWDGIGGLDTIQWTGTTNYQQIATIYPPFWPAFRHNLYWLAALAFIGTPFGMFLAYQLDKRIRGSRFYQSIFYIPVVHRTRDHRPHLASWSCRRSRA